MKSSCQDSNLNVFTIDKKEIIEINDDNANDLIKSYMKCRLYHDFFIFTEKTSDIMKIIRKNNIKIDKKLLLIPNETQSKLFNFKKILGKSGKVGTPYIFNFENIDIIIKVSKNIKLYEREHHNLERYDCFKYYKIKNLDCVPAKESIQHVIGNSEYINETIIGYIFNFIFFNSYMRDDNNNYSLYNMLQGQPNNIGDLGNSVFQLGYFQNEDHSVGYNAMEKADNTIDKLFSSGDFNKIKLQMKGKNISDTNKILLILIQQVNNTLQILKNNYGFNHGDLKAGNIFYKIDDSYLKVDYPLDGYSYFQTKKSNLKCKTNIRLKIADYGKSSLTFNGNRYYCNDMKYKYHKILQIYSSPEKLSFQSLTDDGKYLFDFKGPYALEISMRHLVCPYFLSADYYVFIVSWSLQCKEFYDFLINNKILNVIELQLTKNDLVGHKKPESVITAFKILRGRNLKCSAINESSDYCLNLLENV